MEQEKYQHKICWIWSREEIVGAMNGRNQ